MKIIELICTYPAIFFLGVCGIYFTFKTGFVQIFGVKKLFSKKMEKESISAFMTALGGTVGVGSITGIGYAIAEGGAGSIFWMWISSFFGMGIKYAETYISVKYGDKKNGGAMVALKKSGYKKLGAIFAFLTILASFGGGNSAQSGAMADAFLSVGVSSTTVAIISGILLSLVIFGGKKRIVKVNSYLVPLSTVLYVLGMLFILFKTGDKIPYSVSIIFKEAFGFKQFGMGVSAYLFSRAMRVGTVRGIFSHEAGMGSSPIAHANAERTDPHIQGLWGIAEIYVDTFLVGTLTAFCLMCNQTFSVPTLFLKFFGTFGGIIFAVFMAVFAFAAVLSWCYYSETCLSFLFGTGNAVKIYKVFAVFIFCVGCIAPVNISWVASDILNCLMVYPNLFLLFIKRKEIFYDGTEKNKKILGNIRPVCNGNC